MGRASREPISPLGKFNPDGTSEDRRLQFRGDDWYFSRKTRAESEAAIQAWAADLLIIGGKTHRVADEPLYCVMTFGLGHNHGGTSLSVSSHYNSNIAWQNYFRLDQREEAIKAAEKVALGRGDTQSVPIRTNPTFRILIPEAIQRNPSGEYGGAGDEFCNGIERMIEKTGSAGEAGLLVSLVAAREVTRAAA